MRKTTKLIEGGHRGLQNYRHYMLLGLLPRLYVFKIQKVVTFNVFCHVSYVSRTTTSVSHTSGLIITSLHHTRHSTPDSLRVQLHDCVVFIAASETSQVFHISIVFDDCVE